MFLLNGGVARSRRRPTVTYLLVLLMAGVMLVVYVGRDPLPSRVFSRLSLVPASMFQGMDLYRLVTYMFLHSGLMHFVLNAFSLLGAGILVEREIGSGRFLVLFLASGVAAGLVHSFVFAGSDMPVVGASGAIFGIIAVMSLLMPFKITFIMLVPLPAVVVGILLGVLEVYSAAYSFDPMVAHFAHLGGFAFGGLSAFLIDAKRAARGLVTAVLVYVCLYLLSRLILAL